MLKYKRESLSTNQGSKKACHPWLLVDEGDELVVELSWVSDGCYGIEVILERTWLFTVFSGVGELFSWFWLSDPSLLVLWILVCGVDWKRGLAMKFRENNKNTLKMLSKIYGIVNDGQSNYWLKFYSIHLNLKFVLLS